ncbi:MULTISPECIES: host attachment protein [Methylococcus]|uniref:Host attachment protein n=2 Tax=Methylococcus capsulatus TaxID=414 RepID=Q60BB5_METCA|nr:host attachment protein [Methylococcus capsulatus]AAU93248.1 conserved hypothetical protein [Methylococcus capsulatus str. Bath]QXP88621.1 host attachment protein [Methylococcus capsulatus]QXP89994.1 host attachment protein [Methylococcus capsulatus]QXP94346.1 host attachment protein [Methylococcus capsulatus]UQN10896.1 host attachment protein [Methylococcus capsulatus]
MFKTWVVAAESSRARIFAIDNRLNPLKEIDDLVHAEGRAKEQDLTSDRPGRMLNSSTEGRHDYEKPQDAKQHEAQVFAKRVADRLEQARVNGDCLSLILIAAPEFLGLLRQALSGPTAKLVSKTLDKNLVQKTEQEIRSYIFS